MMDVVTDVIKDNCIEIIICLSVICLLLLITVIYIKIKMSQEIIEPEGRTNQPKSSNDKNKRPKSQKQNGKERINTQPQYGNYQQDFHKQPPIIGSSDSYFGVSHIGNDVTPSKSSVTVEQKEPVQKVYQYLQEANDGRFLKLLQAPDKCFFRTWEDGGVRKFEFWGNVAKALANINAIFDDVCDIEGKRNGATEIENISAGALDAELRITRKAKIRFK